MSPQLPTNHLSLSVYRTCTVHAPKQCLAASLHNNYTRAQAFLQCRCSSHEVLELCCALHYRPTLDLGALMKWALL